MKDNYLEMRNRMRGHFLSYDQQEMIRRFSLKHDADYLYIRFVGRDYRIGRRDGIAEWSEDGFSTCTEAGYNDSMAIYDVLCCSRPGCCLSGNFAPDSSLKGTVYTGTPTGSGIKLFDCAERLSRDAEGLKAACEKLGGTPEGRGDVAYRIPIYEFLPIRFALWHADEDFPADISILWDENVLSFMHYETLWFIKGHLLSRLQEEMQYGQ